MSWTSSRNAIWSIGVVHLLFMMGELFPWDAPLIMTRVLTKWPHPLDLSPNDTQLVSAVVHNAGIYNGIVGAGLFAAASLGRSGFPVQATLLAGGIVAGLFGAATLTPATIAQAVVGAIALGWITSKR